MSVILNTNLNQVKEVAELLDSAADLIWLRCSSRDTADMELNRQLRLAADLLREAMKP